MTTGQGLGGPKRKVLETDIKCVIVSRNLIGSQFGDLLRLLVSRHAQSGL